MMTEADKRPGESLRAFVLRALRTDGTVQLAVPQERGSRDRTLAYTRIYSPAYKHDMKVSIAFSEDGLTVTGRRI